MLANYTNGGEGTKPNKPPTDEYREKIRQMVLGKNNPNYGNHWSEEQKKHLSELRKAKGLSKGDRNSRAKPVMCVETGKIYGCQQYASDELGLKGMGSIYHALLKPHFVAGGYHFVQGEDIEKLNTPEKRNQYLNSLKQSK